MTFGTTLEVVRYRELEPIISTCSNPLGEIPGRLTGPNILLDGGFENSFGFGPLGNEIPGFGDIGGLQYPFLNWAGTSTGPKPPADPLPTKWWQKDNITTSGRRWFVSDANPRTGTYHARISMVSVTQRPGLYPTSYFICPDLSAYFAANGAFQVWEVGQSALVQPGDNWELTFYARINSAINGNRLRVRLILSDSTDTLSYNPDYILTQALTTSYAQFQVGDTIPATQGSGGSGFGDPFVPAHLSLLIENDWTSANSGTVTIDLDDVSLSIT